MPQELTESPTGKEFKVLDILSETRLVIGAGSEDGIKSQTEFFIYGLGESYEDAAGRQYEPLELIRGYAKVIHVQKTICTVQSRQTIQKRVPVPQPYFGGISGIAGTLQTQYESVTVAAPFNGVQVGDNARVIREG
jgi:hypothetical protein